MASRPPLVSAEEPERTLKSCMPSMGVSISARIGKESMTKSISLTYAAAKFSAWPFNPNPVTSVAPLDPYFCISLALV